MSLWNVVDVVDIPFRYFSGLSGGTENQGSGGAESPERRYERGAREWETICEKKAPDASRRNPMRKGCRGQVSGEQGELSRLISLHMRGTLAEQEAPERLFR